ncbi:UV DNA damage repair endonuclease UvsE [Jatrophihabitans sp. YIM 134969]
MRIGYAAINRTLADEGVRSHARFMLKSWSPQRFRDTLAANLSGLQAILEWNVEHGLLMHRVTSDLVPFGAHPVVDVDWRTEFAEVFAEIGAYVQAYGMRLSFHPGQYTLINSPNEQTHARSVDDLGYHCDVLEAMGLDATHKFQIHGGGAYGDMAASLSRFVERYDALPQRIRDRLVLENDDFGIGWSEVVWITERCGVPVLLDNLHLAVTDEVYDVSGAVARAAATWGTDDGPPLVDYSSQDLSKRLGTHAAEIVPEYFSAWLHQVRTAGVDVDVVLEIKDKERSALVAMDLVQRHAG